MERALDVGSPALTGSQAEAGLLSKEVCGNLPQSSYPRQLEAAWSHPKPLLIC